MVLQSDDQNEALTPPTVRSTLASPSPNHYWWLDKDTVLTGKLSDLVAQKQGFATLAYETPWIRTFQRTTVHGEAVDSQPTFIDPHLLRKCRETWCTSVRYIAAHQQLGWLDRCQRNLDEG